MSLEMTEKLLEGGVFNAVQKNISAVECVDFVTSCEVDFAKITLKAKRLCILEHFICHIENYLISSNWNSR